MVATAVPDTTGEVTELRFAAMGTRVHLVGVGASEKMLTDARDAIDDLERRWSRFRPDSEISSLNGSAGEAISVSHETYLLVQRGCQAWHLSDGAFDPTVLGAMVANGYDRPFDDLASVPLAQHAPTGRTPGCSGIDLDDRRGTVRLPPGVGFDPGGIGKGLAADLVSARLMGAGAAGCLVSIGGDLVARGGHPAGAWTIVVDEPDLGFDGPVATVSFTDGALATSTTARRRWARAGAEHHHLVDPRTGRPHDSDVVLTTAVACEGWLAEATTKAAMAASPSAALRSVPRLVLRSNGTLEAHAGMEDFLS